MKIPFLSTILLGLAASFAGSPAASLRLQVKCPECPDSGKAVREACRKAMPAHGFDEVDSTAKAPTLRIYAYPESGRWVLAPTLSSPGGTVLNVSREEFRDLAELTSTGVDSTLATARRTVDEAVKRAKEASNRK